MRKDILYLIPAYGRSYPTKEAALYDWELGKDFKILKGPYTSIRDFETLKNDYDVIFILYGINEDIKRILLWKRK